MMIIIKIRIMMTIMTIIMIMIMMIIGINDGWMPTSAAPNWDSAAKASQLPKAY